MLAWRCVVAVVVALLWATGTLSATAPGASLPGACLSSVDQPEGIGALARRSPALPALAPTDSDEDELRSDPGGSVEVVCSERLAEPTTGGCWASHGSVASSGSLAARPRGPPSLA